jgi:DNA-binding GntR family transcriptional regulator
MTAQERTLAALRQDILTGVLPPGQQLVQEHVAERYDVSRVPVREALQLLTSEGLVSHVPNRGYFVTALSVTDLAEVYRLREILEAEALRAAVPALRDEDVAEVRALAEGVERAADAGDLGGLTQANRRFHFALFDAAGMPRLTRLLRQLWDASDVYRALYFGQAVNRDRVRTEHAAMLAALERRDAEETIRLHDVHREHSVAWVRAQLLRSSTESGVTP